MSVVPLSVISAAPVLPLIPAVITLFCELATVKSLSLSATAPVRVTAPVPAVMVRSSFPPLLKVSVDPKVTSPPPAPVPTAVALPLSPVTAPLKSIAPPTVVTSAPKLAASRVIVPVPLIARSPLMSVGSTIGDIQGSRASAYSCGDHTVLRTGHR